MAAKCLIPCTDFWEVKSVMDSSYGEGCVDREVKGKIEVAKAFEMVMGCHNYDVRLGCTQYTMLYIYSPVYYLGMSNTCFYAIQHRKQEKVLCFLMLMPFTIP